jgi:hypothetical protein
MIRGGSPLRSMCAGLASGSSPCVPAEVAHNRRPRESRRRRSPPRLHTPSPASVQVSRCGRGQSSPGAWLRRGVAAARGQITRAGPQNWPVLGVLLRRLDGTCRDPYRIAAVKRLARLGRRKRLGRGRSRTP